MIRRRMFILFAALSLSLFSATVVLWAISYGRSWKDGGITLFGNTHAGASNGTVAVYNQSRPFFDGTISMSSAGAPPAKWPREVALRFPGFHFRHFTWPGEWPGDTYWTFALSMVYPLVLTAIAPVLWVAIHLRRRGRGAAGRCLDCGYILTGNTSGVCPECGTPVRQKAETAT